MNAKDKAMELVDKYEIFADYSFYFQKQCALICVDEILKNCLKDIADAYYWEEVKNEINKL